MILYSNFLHTWEVDFGTSLYTLSTTEKTRVPSFTVRFAACNISAVVMRKWPFVTPCFSRTTRVMTASPDLSVCSVMMP